MKKLIIISLLTLNSINNVIAKKTPTKLNCDNIILKDEYNTPQMLDNFLSKLSLF